MNRLDSRVGDLERAQGLTKPRHTVIYITFVSPSPDGPVDEGVGIVTILGGGSQFCRKNYRTDDAFWNAANEEHERIHGEPLKRAERTTA